MNEALLKRIDDARWSARETVDVKISELESMISELTQLRQEKIQAQRDEQYNENERLLGFVKLEAIQGMRRGKIPSCRLLKYKHAPYFVIPVYLKMSEMKKVLKWNPDTQN